MLNIDRLKMEVKGITLTNEEWDMYLLESGLISDEYYQPNNHNNKKQLLTAALSILESIANNPQSMKDYVIDDMTVSQFHENLMARIDQLENKINNIVIENESNMISSTFMLYND